MFDNIQPIKPNSCLIENLIKLLHAPLETSSVVCCERIEWRVLYCNLLQLTNTFWWLETTYFLLIKLWYEVQKHILVSDMQIYSTEALSFVNFFPPFSLLVCLNSSLMLSTLFYLISDLYIILAVPTTKSRSFFYISLLVILCITFHLTPFAHLFI